MLNVPNNGVSLTNASNAIGAVAANVQNLGLTTTGDLVVTAAGGFTGLAASGTVSLSLAGDLGQTAPLTAPALDVASTGGGVALDLAGNAIGLFAATARSITLTNSIALTVASFGNENGLAVSDGGVITLNVPGAAITQAAPIAAPNLVLNAPGQVVTLSDGGNRIASLAGSVGSLTLTDTGALSVASVGGFNGLAVGGAFSLTSSGAVSQTAPLSTPLLVLSAPGQTVNLAGPNNLVGAVSGNVGSLTLGTGASLSIGSGGLSAAGAVVLGTGAGGITQAGPIAATDVILDAAGQTVTLLNTGNAFTNIAGGAGSLSLANTLAVSYTHLTLPTT